VLVLLLFIVAVIVICIELFLPGGVFGVLGIILLIASMVLAFRQYHEFGIWIVAVELIVASTIILIGIKRFPKSYAGKLLILGRNLDKKSGFSGTEELEKYIGKEGVSMTHLRPSGIALIDSRRLDVVTEGTFIDKDKRIKIVCVEGNRVVVREIGNAIQEREES
jgi:membrane-bound serine protease (ClpP class)